MTDAGARPWRNDVLNQLDEAAEAYNLLGPANVNYPSAAVRMDTFASDTDWLVTIQMLAWSRQGLEFVNLLQTFGNEFDTPGEIIYFNPVQPGKSQEFWDNEGEFIPDLHNFTVEINGSERNFTPSSDDYLNTGIELDEMPPELAFIRFIASRISSDILLHPTEILEALHKESTRHLFSTSGWQAPDPAEEDKPSESRCFQEIAEAIQHRAHQAPASCTEDANTDWRNWTWLVD
jgi:hypothetical protein